MSIWTRILYQSRFTTVLFLLCCGAASLNGSALGGDVVGRPAANRFPRMVQEYLVGRVKALHRDRQDRLSRIGSREQALEYIRTTRASIRESFGKMPERTPLNARVTRTLTREGYRVEMIVFESRPGFFVTANLYIPTNRSFPRPGVIGTCGHSNNGKAAEPYQAFCQGLVHKGYVVLIYDPISQGERLQYVGESMESRHGAGVMEHLVAGNQQFLVGEFLGAWRAWDGIRALDYLLSRPEVDSRFVGVTGNSGGGTMTTWLCGLDDRWTMAAPSCFVTSFRRNFENELPADTEQCPPRALALGLDHADFIAALAPKPVVLLTKERDYFDVRGSEQAFSDLSHLYGILAASDDISLFTGPTGHGYSQENREAMYAWFNRATGSQESSEEADIQIEPDDALYCAPDGQVARLDSKPIHVFTAEKARQLKARRTPLRGKDLRQAVRQKLQLDIGRDPPDYRILRPRGSRNYPTQSFTTYAVQTEPGIHAVVYRLSDAAHQARPPQASGAALLYVSDISSDDELRNCEWLRELIAGGGAKEVYACDVRGTGESQPDACGEDSFLHPYGSDYFHAIYSLMLDDPYPGQKARDVLRVVQWLEAQGRTEIHLVSQGRGAVPCAIAALFADGVTRITLRQAPTSYQSIAEAEAYDWPLSCFIPNVLDAFDLPDLYEDLSMNKKSAIIDLAGPERTAPSAN